MVCWSMAVVSHRFGIFLWLLEHGSRAKAANPAGAYSSFQSMKWWWDFLFPWLGCQAILCTSNTPPPPPPPPKKNQTNKKKKKENTCQVYFQVRFADFISFVSSFHNEILSIWWVFLFLINLLDFLLGYAKDGNLLFMFYSLCQVNCCSDVQTTHTTYPDGLEVLQFPRFKCSKMCCTPEVS